MKEDTKSQKENIKQQKVSKSKSGWGPRIKPSSKVDCCWIYIIWGQISVQSDKHLALILSAIGLMLGALTITKYRLMKDGNSKIDKTPFLHWPIPNIIVGSGIEQKPVLIKIRIQDRSY